MTLILAVDDDPSILRTVRTGLVARGFEVITSLTGTDAVAIIIERSPAAAVLDLGLPDIDGLELVRQIRKISSVPIIVLSADGSDIRKVNALELGADDYVTKPFSLAELVARINVALRHQRRPAIDIQSVLRVNSLSIDVSEHRCTIDGEPIDLTPKEFAMLALLARWPGRLVTHRMILQEVWGPSYDTETHYLRVYASQIRKKLGEGPGVPELISEPGVGYRLVAEIP
jgi:two-component system KDP operon response regulator KdpE